LNRHFERARDGDPLATAALVDALRPRVTKMAFHYARRCREDPDDLLQEAWVGLLEALPALDLDIGSPEQYLVSRARWRLLDAIKREHVRRCASLDDVADEHVCRMETGASTASAAEFIRSLSRTQRAVLGCLLAGLSWREAGEFLGCTSPNIAYHVRQIRRRYQEWSLASETAGSIKHVEARHDTAPQKGGG